MMTPKDQVKFKDIIDYSHNVILLIIYFTITYSITVYMEPAVYNVFNTKAVKKSLDLTDNAKDLYL